MSLMRANGHAVISSVVSLPLFGVWVADLAVDQLDALDFKPGASVTCETDDGSLELEGTVLPDRGGAFIDTTHVRIVGGKAGLAKVATPKFFRSPQALLRDVFNALLGDAGESLSATVSAALLASNLDAWTITRMPVSQALNVVLARVAPDAGWRILPDGTWWAGTETWTKVRPELEVLRHDPADGSFELGVDRPIIVPGQDVEGVGKVARVEHTLSRGGKVRSKVWIAGAREERGIKEEIAELVADALPEVDLMSLYEAKVVTQSADLSTVDLRPVDSRIPGLTKVPLHNPPGYKAQISSGGLVRVGWAGGDPSKPFAFTYTGGVQLITIGGDGSAQFAALSNKVNANFDAIWAVLNGVFGAASPPLVTPAPASPDPVYTAVKAAIAAQQLALQLPPVDTAATRVKLV